LRPTRQRIELGCILFARVTAIAADLHTRRAGCQPCLARAICNTISSLEPGSCAVAVDPAAGLFHTSSDHHHFFIQAKASGDLSATWDQPAPAASCRDQDLSVELIVRVRRESD
jgi:hypothetical protein